MNIEDISFYVDVDRENGVFIHGGKGFISGFPFKYEVESRSLLITEWDVEQIVIAFNMQERAMMPVEGSLH